MRNGSVASATTMAAAPSSAHILRSVHSLRLAISNSTYTTTQGAKNIRK
jgi:hypothetical protein